MNILFLHLFSFCDLEMKKKKHTFNPNSLEAEAGKIFEVSRPDLSTEWVNCSTNRAQCTEPVSKPKPESKRTKTNQENDWKLK